MATKEINCTIKGKTPLLMHAFPFVPLEAIEKKSPKEQAEYCVYRDQETQELYIPGTAIQRCLVSGATYSKGKGRSSLQKQVAACVMITPEVCSLGIKDYIIDSRPVVNPSTKGRIMRHRPRLNQWNVSFLIEYDDTLLKEEEVRKIVDDSGSRVGLLDFRPEKKGSFGRFMVTEWK